MLICADHENKIEVFRIVDDGEGRSVRERVGAVPKKDFAIGEAFDRLSEEEFGELMSTIDIYKEARNVRAKAAALAFPQTVRQVVDYFEASADECQRKLIFTALKEGLRRVRQASKEQEVAPGGAEFKPQ